MRKFTLLLIFLLPAMVVQAQESDFRKHIGYLASDSLHGRLAGSADDSLTAVYLRQELQTSGYQALTDNGWQVFGYTAGKRQGQPHQVNTRNVVMWLPATPHPAKESIVIGAHFDHLGMGGIDSGSRKPDTIAVHNGADDNASGVAMVLNLAKILAIQQKKLKRNIIVVFFGAEEQGIIGSKYFVEHRPDKAGQITMMFNFDMVGRLDTAKHLQINGTKTFVDAETLLRTKQFNQEGLQLQFSGGGYGPSDHMAFYAAGIPVLFFTSGVHYDYHTPKDDIDKINFPGMKLIADYALQVILNIASAAKAPVFQQAGDNAPVRTHGKFKVTLGLVPDFNAVYEGPGMRADFITEGKPAHKAGLKNGDVILEINGNEIKNIEDYMQQLGLLDAGSTVNLKIKRGEQIMFFTVQL